MEDETKKLTESVNRLTVKVETFCTIASAHIEEQKATNKHIAERLEAHDREIKDLNEWRAVQNATTVPQVRQHQEAITQIKQTLAKYAAGIAVAIVLIEIGIKLAFKG